MITRRNANIMFSRLASPALLLVASVFLGACPGPLTPPPEDLVPLAVDQDPSATTNLAATIVAKFDRTSSYHFTSAALEAFGDQLLSLIDAGACDIKVYAGYIEVNSYSASAQLPPVVVPACPAPPDVPLIRPEPPPPDPAGCSPFDTSCRARFQSDYEKRRGEWARERDLATGRYVAALNAYERSVRAIADAARAEIASLAERPVPIDNRGTDLRGAWISAGELLASERGRQTFFVVASDLRPDGYQAQGEILPLGEVGVSVVFFQCDDAVFCQAVKRDLPAVLGVPRVDFFSPAQSQALAVLFSAEVSR